jgi:hypothetical protein
VKETTLQDKGRDPFALRLLDWLLGAPTDLSDAQRFTPALLAVIAVLVGIVAVWVVVRL